MATKPVDVVLVVLITIVLIVGLSAGIAALIMVLWNFAVAEPFGLPRIAFLQTWAIVFLINIVVSLFRRKS